MSSQLLATKFYIPPARANRVPRPELTRRLTEGLARKLTLVSAPPGFGKTTLLAEGLAVAAGLGLAVCWVSLDEGDSDLNRFFSYFIAACQTVQAGLGESMLAMLRSAQPPPIESLLTDLLNDIARARAFALVLDDYHVITAPAIDHALSFLLDHLPANLHLVIATRSDPLFRLSQLRARGEMLELRASDLRFSSAEAAAFLNQVMHLNLSPADIAALETRTEGWVAGLQLAALSMKGRTDAGNFIAAFTGSNRYIIGYLVEQVLDLQPPARQQFLLQTSLLPRMNASLCDALTGRGDGEAMLAQLDAGNLFLIPLDDRQEWFRYHHLFAEVLQSRLRKAQPQQMHELHARASEWFAQHGNPQEAIEHACAGEDWTRAARLIRQNGEALLKRSETSTLRQWLDALPEAVLQGQPWLCLWYAELCGLAHQLDEANRYLAYAERAAQSAAAGTDANPAGVQARIRFLRTSLALNAGDLPLTITLANDALANLRAEEAEMRGWLLLRLGTAYLQTGKLAEGAQALAESSRLSQSVGDLLTTLYALDNLAGAYLLQAQLIQAAGLYQQALDVFAARGAGRMPITGLIHADLAEVQYEWNNLAGAAEHLAEAVELGEIGGLPRTLVNAYIQWVRVRLAGGDLAAARDALAKARQLVEKYRLPLFFFGRVDACEARLWLAEGDWAAAAEWAAAVGPRFVAEPGFLRETVYLMLARALNAQGEWRQSLDFLARLESAASAEGRTGSLVEIYALQAVAMHQLRERAAALATIERSLALAEPSGYLRMFLDEGEPMRALLAEVRAVLAGRAADAPRRTPSPVLNYTDKLLAAFARAAPAPATKPESVKPSTENPLEPLSERELEILRLLAAGRSNADIAAALVLAVGTVKKHTNNIFGKLGARNRVEAVARARAYGLLGG